MAAIAFPLLKPSARSYSPGTFPQTEFRAQNGALTILRYGNRRVDSTLSLEFRNITDDNAALIIQNYEAVNSRDNNVTFTETTGAAGTSAAYSKFIKEDGTGLKWRYAGPPEITSVVNGRCTVVCEFVGNLLAN
jgi:hypothetical protein